MTEEPRITRLESSDVDAILALWEKSGLPYKPKGRDDRKRLRDVIERGIEAFWGIYEEEKLVGVILVTHDGRKGWINRLAVDPAYQGKGWARRLIRQAEDYLREAGVEIVAVLVENWNKESLNLFRSCGYTLHDDIYYLSKREQPDV
ncbi:MAG: GNAT family N-acetyltransferase [Candidatus Latescibacteria bacterium]|nr:GNAT family N-acetyltransferase [Candidatus Latescibacterota bacterium]NIM21813.1 GNAT family N-acetyltransferase [Candidatus Latescibacterota bacterium]NIM65951.1 GNAT family N-acetyltransferase [Candidatus Latescibacterota bacterium]NIO02696.1 GNAT family N-acetyltransferase [Candidatus Latescibacterota bacterium]NIO29677.1 GNAT family N-acetyltransferase [Candidatus Latescibacterota bacterium]